MTDKTQRNIAIPVVALLLLFAGTGIDRIVGMVFDTAEVATTAGTSIDELARRVERVVDRGQQEPTVLDEDVVLRAADDVALHEDVEIEAREHAVRVLLAVVPALLEVEVAAVGPDRCARYQRRVASARPRPGRRAAPARPNR